MFETVAKTILKPAGNANTRLWSGCRCHLVISRGTGIIFQLPQGLLLPLLSLLLLSNIKDELYNVIQVLLRQVTGQPKTLLATLARALLTGI